MWRFTCSSSHCAVRPASPSSSRASTSRTVRRGNRSLHTWHAPRARARQQPITAPLLPISGPLHQRNCTAPMQAGEQRGYLVEEMERNRGAVHLGRLPPNWNAEEDEQYVQE